MAFAGLLNLPASAAITIAFKGRNLGGTLIIAEKRLAPRHGVATMSFVFRPELRAVFVFDRTIIIYYA